MCGFQFVDIAVNQSRIDDLFKMVENGVDRAHGLSQFCQWKKCPCWCSRSSGCGCASWFDALFLNPINWYNDQYIQKMERYASWFRRPWKARIPADVRAASVSGCCLRLRDNSNCRFPPGGHRSARLSLRSSNGGKLPGATDWSVR